MTMRRRHRVGQVAFELGHRGAPRAHGYIAFSDSGALLGGSLYGRAADKLEMLELARALEFGVLVDESAPEVTLDTAPVAIYIDPQGYAPASGPIMLPELTGPLDSSELVLAAVADADAPILAVDVSVATMTIPIPIVITLPIPVRKTRSMLLAERQAEVAATVPAARAVWGRFFFGIACVLQMIYGLAVNAVNPYHNAGWPVIVGMSVVLGIIGVGVTGAAVRSNDERIRTLEEVGLR
jgi:hypothetical protein